MLKVFYTYVSDLPTSVEGLTLSEYRLNKLKKISLDEKRKQSIGAELLLNHALKSVFPELKAPHEIYADDLGKIYFKSLPLKFSLSHSGNIAVCAISDENVGIDVEAEIKYKAKISERFFSAGEIQRLRVACDKDAEFGRIWTAKESALKYLGLGLSRDLSSVELINEDTIRLSPENTSLKVMYKDLSGVHISVCTAGEIVQCLEQVKL